MSPTDRAYWNAALKKSATARQELQDTVAEFDQRQSQRDAEQRILLLSLQRILRGD